MKTIELTSLNAFPFAGSVTVSGSVTEIRIANKDMVRDCNMAFVTDSLSSLTKIDSMFDGCRNAAMSNGLTVPYNTITSAASAFKDCESAKIPFVDIGESSLTDCRSMFENCYTAELCGATIPSSATYFGSMYKNAKSASFEDISSIPLGEIVNGRLDYSELFCGCENGTFEKLSFTPTDGNKLDTGFMFYFCRSMNCGNLRLEDVSDNIVSADYMFYSAGANGSDMMDGKVFSFGMLETCESMFANSNFAFDGSFFRFHSSLSADGYDDGLTSLKGMFSGCGYGYGRVPTVIIGETTTVGDIDYMLDYRLNGYYNDNTRNEILDFSHLYENSSFKTLDIRGICNNGDLATARSSKRQNFTAMCRNCVHLEDIVGYLPPYASSYSSMFDGCRSLSIDISKLFKNQEATWTSIDDIPDAFEGDNAYASYMVDDIRNMFNGCGDIYSTNDGFDLVGLFKTVAENAGDYNVGANSVYGSMPPIRLAAHEPVPDIYGAIYDISDISSRTGTVRFNSFAVEPYEEDSLKESYSLFGLYSQYAKNAFSHGYYRYGGVFPGEKDKCFFIIYYPVIGEGVDAVVGFERMTPSSTVRLKPHGWNEAFETDSSKNSWNDYSIGDIYAGMVCDINGRFIKYAYIGNYVRVLHERKSDSDGTFVVDSRFEMPVTYFDGTADGIAPLNN